MLGHLVRRTLVEQVKDRPLDKQAEAFSMLNYEMPGWGIALLAGTFVSWLVMAFLIEYTINMLLVNLTIIESPASATVATYKPIYSDDPDAPLEKKDEAVDIEIETATVTTQPITNSIKKTLQHLKSIGGYRSRYRGFRLFVLYSFVTGVVHLLFAALPIPASSFFGTFAAAVAGARIHCAWTHQTIAMPSNKTMCERRIPSHMFKHLVGPALLKTASIEASALLFVLNVCLSWNRVQDLIDAKSDNVAFYLFWAIQPILIGICSFFYLIMPAHIILIRREASLLSEEEEIIVPMDRTFGGYVNSASDVLSIRGALKGFSGEAWYRLVKLYFKYFFISVAIGIFLVELLALEMWFIMGDNLFVLISSVQAQIEQFSL